MSTRIKKSDLARDALYEKVNTMVDELDNSKVSKSGDTMTGQLVVKDANIILSSTKDVVNAFIKTDEDDTQTPTKNHIDAFRVVDKNNKIMSDFRSQRNSTSNLTQMIARKNNVDGTIKQADITCSVDSNGNASSTLNQTTHVNGTVVSNLDNVNFIAKSKSLVKGTTPTDGNKYVGYDWQDKNGQRLAYLGVAYGTSGIKRLELQKLDNNLSEFNISYPIRNPYNFYFQDTQHTLGNVNVNTWINNQIQFKDSKGTRLARVQPMLAADGTVRLCLAASKNAQSDYSLVIGSDGYTQCPKPADNSNTNAIATTNWAGGLKRENNWNGLNTFNSSILRRIKGLDTNTTPSSSKYFDWLSPSDENGVSVGYLGTTQTKNDILFSRIGVTRFIKERAIYNELSIGTDANGSSVTNCPRCNLDNSIVTTMAHGTNYVRFGNGLQICWGNSPVNQTITLPQAFKDANYKITFCQTDGGEHNINQVVTDKTTTSFRFSRGYTGDWIAIGYWY